MQNIESQLLSFIRSAFASGGADFVDDFVANGPIPGGRDGAYRYLLAVALSSVSAVKLAEVAQVSVPVAEALKQWLDAGTRS